MCVSRFLHCSDGQTLVIFRCDFVMEPAVCFWTSMPSLMQSALCEWMEEEEETSCSAHMLSSFFNTYGAVNTDKRHVSSTSTSPNRYTALRYRWTDTVLPATGKQILIGREQERQKHAPTLTYTVLCTSIEWLIQIWHFVLKSLSVFTEEVRSYTSVICKTRWRLSNSLELN